MKVSTAKLLTESEVLLARLRKRHRALPWCAAPALIRECQQVRRILKDAAVRTERVELSRQLIDLMVRMQGVWRATRGHAAVPGWLKEGQARRVGTTSDTAITEFFRRMSGEVGLRQMAAKLLGDPWREQVRVYSRWRLLLRREQKAVAQQKTALKELIYFVRLLRSLLA